ncbi:MAG TPA: hypothetical protein VNM90_02935 [Haliangium sp.]|nr:hypothetical protein [Haliangium sp.]
MLLRSEENAAVAQVHRRLGHLADGYRDAARFARMQGWPGLARMFDELATQRAAMRRRVGSLMEDLGDAPPRDPDPERRFLARMTRRLRALWSADHQPMLVRALERKEDSLATAIAAALALDLPDRVASALARIRAAMDGARRQLAETRIEVSHARPAGPVMVAS